MEIPQPHTSFQILLWNDAIFDKPYATNIGETYTRKTLIPYFKITSIH